MLRYVDGRNTDDIDLVLSAESLARVPEIAIADTNANFAAGTFRSLRVDVRFASNPVFRRVMDSRMVMHPFAEMEVPCATVEGLVNSSCTPCLRFRSSVGSSTRRCTKRTLPCWPRGTR